MSSHRRVVQTFAAPLLHKRQAYSTGPHKMTKRSPWARHMIGGTARNSMAYLVLLAQAFEVSQGQENQCSRYGLPQKLNKNNVQDLGHKKVNKRQCSGDEPNNVYKKSNVQDMGPQVSVQKVINSTKITNAPGNEFPARPPVGPPEPGVQGAQPPGMQGFGGAQPAWRRPPGCEESEGQRPLGNMYIYICIHKKVWNQVIRIPDNPCG